MKRPNASTLLVFAILLLVGCGGRSMGLDNGNAFDDGGANSNQDAATESPCALGTCEGCCNAVGVCHSGLADDHCGLLSAECADCAALSGICVEGQCQGTEPCGPNNCTDGCCTAAGDCVSGTFSSACGSGGNQCVDCGTRDCREGSCCLDLDGDGTGEGCPLGEDCDDQAPGIVGPCQPNGCPQGWAYVPAGMFIAGYPPDSPSQFVPAQHDRYLDAFCIELTEVSVARYRECESAGVCNNLVSDYADSVFCNWSVDGTGDLPDLPLNCIPWWETRNYCQSWFGGDLPTEWQWEKAARGTDGRPFPWGPESALDCSRCNYSWCLGETADTYMWSVGYLGSAGDSPFGLKDMCGNIMEFTRSCRNWYEDREECLLDGNEAIVQRGVGGMFHQDNIENDKWYTTYFRELSGQDPDDNGVSGSGFRCMRLPVPSQ
ncbi:MAG: SUMF1/EgtB/PvdO family nonheme iron enzyme [Candidatus Zixiibacteriota bacterium]